MVRILALGLEASHSPLALVSSSMKWRRHTGPSVVECCPRGCSSQERLDQNPARVHCGHAIGLLDFSDPQAYSLLDGDPETT